MKIIVLDTETTGLDYDKDHVIEIAIKYGLERGVDADVWHVKPPIPIPPDISAIHGFTDENTANFPLFGQVADHIANAIESADVLVGYNPDFDIGMLNREFKLAGREVKWPSVVIDPKRMWDIYDPPEKRSLTNAFKKFVDEKGFEGAHGALADINATAEVLLAQIDRFGLQGKDWKDLDPERAKWVGPSNHLQWRDTYRESILVTFGKHKGKDFADLDDWYLGYLIEKDFPAHIKAIAEQMKKINKQKIPMPAKAIALWAKERFQ